MNFSPEWLAACLSSYARPKGVEAWVVPYDLAGANTVPLEYRRAVHDMLITLGVINPETGAFASPNAFYFAQSLTLGLREGSFDPSMWEGRPQDGDLGTGAAILEHLEKHRMGGQAKVTPMRRVRVVMGIIKRQQGGQSQYLMQYDHKAAQFQPIGGKVEDSDPTIQQALEREIREELGDDSLRMDKDFQARLLVSSIREQIVSRSLHILTEYEHNFFAIEKMRFTPNLDADTRWINEAEVFACRTLDDLAVTDLLKRHLSSFLAQMAYSL
jgi:8-oxo-dGTP pyrophosphatase MutT (NUDIX family)